MSQDPAPQSSILLYQTEDGRTRIQCRFQDQTLWLTQKLIADLFQISVKTANEHLLNIFEDAELNAESVIRKFRITAADGKTYETQHYNLDAILAVGYRVRSTRGIQFRQWATSRLSEYLLKGFTIDDERLKNPPGPGVPDYFDELLERIRDIRSSERRFYQKILDIYATSIDYSPNAKLSQQFFATVQNKIHFAAHGLTAAELIHLRADASQPHMGLKSTRPGNIIRKDDVSIAKNYLDEAELNTLNHIVTAYLEFAELQALNRQPTTMQNYITKLDDFLKLSGRDLLTHIGNISHDAAKSKAEKEYAQYKKQLDTQPRPIDADFDQAAKKIQKLPQPKKPKKDDIP